MQVPTVKIFFALSCITLQLVVSTHLHTRYSFVSVTATRHLSDTNLICIFLRPEVIRHVLLVGGEERRPHDGGWAALNEGAFGSAVYPTELLMNIKDIGMAERRATHIGRPWGRFRFGSNFDPGLATGHRGDGKITHAEAIQKADSMSLGTMDFVYSAFSV
jgi:hypothetical protein